MCPGSAVWKTLHDALFGVFGCGSFVVGAALCYLAILYTRGEDLLPHIAKLLLGLVFASSTVIVFSDIPADVPGGDHGSRLLPERRQRLAVRRRAGCRAGR